MFVLFWDSADFGVRFKRAGHEEVKAHFASLEEAQAQAEHDLERGRRPLRIEDPEGNVVWSAPQG